ncbi:MAG: PEGA domain-containing protein [Methanoregula sp.]|nr:PEGA domain-containing protein [Methanoregula sp.]
MKKISLVIGALLLLLLLPSAVSALGNISVSSDPVGATIYVDNENKGTTVAPSFTVTNVATGTRGVVLQLSGYMNFTASAVVTDGGTYPIVATLTPNPPAPTILSITPIDGYNNSAVTITLAGTGFVSGATVNLTKSGQANITATSVSFSSAIQIAPIFPITGKPAGIWNIVVTNPDGQSATYSSFEIKNPGTVVTLSSITPPSAVTNTTASITGLAGTNFQTSATMRLRRSGYNDIYGTVTTLSSTAITGTFNLTNQVPGPYQVCVINPSTDAVCGLTFTINAISSTANGSINVISSPSISKIFLNNVFQDYTPMTLYNITPGTYTVMVRSAGYNDYSESVSVSAGNTSYVTASLVLAPEVTTTTTTVPPTTVTTVKTTVKSTLKVPTPWPTDTPTPASPVGVLVILGAVGVGLIVLRKL